MSDFLETSRHGAVLIVALNRPAQLNAFNLGLGVELVAALEGAAAANVGAVVLTGRGRAFSAGADLKDLGIAPMPGGRLDLQTALTETFNRPVRLIRDLGKPVIAALNGPTVGIAVSYALACDLVISARSAYVLAPFASIGLVPDGGLSCLATARAGVGIFNRLCMLAQRVPASEALTWGLIDHVVDDEALEQDALALGQRLAAMPAGSFAAIKQLVNSGPLQHLDNALSLEAQLQGERAASAEFADAREQFGRHHTPGTVG